MLGAARVVLVASGIALIMLGLVVLVDGGPGSVTGAIFLLVPGAVMIVVPWFERRRYRSLARDRSDPAAGPGGGEPSGPPNARFGPTDEVFIDPESGHRMRVYLDPRTGDRRYLAED